ncbi:hypothetical protein [Streptomyces alboniger]|uniref:Aromatic ring-opening dioxygenase LigA n=1 Tax=Streptomyces alboniger TaxID=132473 RepID=A0A5J6HRU3_STRAD|nr:hypothetical protein [Streptomyces alboniger]QEV20990.1 hypothetical protein CP975_28645 [Streptomyces alboniger]
MARLTWEGRAGRVVLTSCGALVALALIAGGYYWWGGPHERRAARQVLAESCGGVLPSDEMRAVLGDGPFESGPGRAEVRAAGEDAYGGKGDTRQVTCTVRRETERGAGRPTHDASVEVTVQRLPERPAASTAEDREVDVPRGFGALYPSVSTELPPAALGGGWQGLFTTGESLTSAAGEDSATATVLLDCARRRGGLLVTVDVEVEDVTLDDPRRRTALARIATATAAKASGKWGCDAELGKPPRTVPLPVNADEDVPLADASGSCRGVPGRGSRVSRAWEGTRPGGPVEVCVLSGGGAGEPVTGSDHEERRYSLVAYYGPYAVTERLLRQERVGRYSDEPVPGDTPAGGSPGGGHWASAACRDGGGPALFTVERSGAVDGKEHDGDDARRATKASAADLAYEKAALKEFARRSARAHGCGAPKLP